MDESTGDSSAGKQAPKLLKAGNYRLDQLLATGGQGEIYLGRDLVDDNVVVIKCLGAASDDQDREKVERFEREGEILHRLDHPNIVNMLDIFREDGQHHIVMEYVPGGNLRQILAAGPQMALDRVLDIVIELADALARAHHLGILHRDVKPSNVLMAADGTPRLTDFGVARFSGSDSRITQSGAIIGSPAYMSPEALRGEELDTAADVWSLGIVLYEMLAGQHPFEGQQLGNLLTSVLTKPLPDIRALQPYIPDKLAILLQRMLVKERNKRFSSMRLVAAELEAIRQGIDSDEVFDTPWYELGDRLGSHSDIPHSLPSPRTRFIGREKELVDLDHLLAEPETRLVTITGPGGMGKTRLALAVAERELLAHGEATIGSSAFRFPDGVFFVSLQALSTAEQIPAMINTALAFQPLKGDPAGRSPWAQTLDYLAPRQMLLLFDNFEHLLEGVHFLSEILEATRGVKILLTSREKVALHGERVYRLGGLEHPQPPDEPATAANLLQNYSAMNLLVEAAQRLLPGYQPVEPDVVYLETICRLVEGMPLGLELAAGWVELLSFKEIAQAIELDLGILETELVDLPDRHRSISAVFESSWRYLPGPDQEALMRLSIFPGGFTRKAASSAAGVSLKQLTGFMRKSLIQYDQQGERFRFHGLFRQFLSEQLAKDPEMEIGARKSHGEYFDTLLANWVIDLKGKRQRAAMVAMEAESLNIEQAWDWAVTNRRIDLMDKALEGMLIFYLRSGRWREIDLVTKELIEILSGTKLADEQKLLVKVLARRGWVLDDALDYPLVEKSLELIQSLELQGHDLKHEKAYTLGRIAFFRLAESQEEAEGLLHQSRLLFQTIGDRWGEAGVLELQSQLALMQGAFNDANEYLGKSLAIRNETGDRTGQTNALLTLANVKMVLGLIDDSIELSMECVRIFESDHNLYGLGTATNALAWSLLYGGQFEAAEEAFKKYREVFSGVLAATAPWLTLLEDPLAHFRGNYDYARPYYKDKSSLDSALDSTDISFLFAVGVAALAERRYDEAVRIFERQIKIREEDHSHVGMSLSLPFLALAYRGVDRFQEAFRQISESLRLTINSQVGLGLVYLLPASAALLVSMGEKEQAVEVYETALLFPHVANAQLFEDVVGVEIKAAAAELPPEAVAEAKKRGKAADPWAVTAELAEEFALYNDS